MSVIRIGTRKSHLAQIQADQVISGLKSLYPEQRFEKVLLDTVGDQDQHTDLTAMGGQGVFVKRLQEALLKGEIDGAVHSAKDMPSVEPNGLTIAAYPQRASVNDVLLTKIPITDLADLPQGAVVGTSSTRRRFQLLTLRPDLEVIPLRGNIETRIEKLVTQGYDGIIMAQAALERNLLPLEALGAYPLPLPLPDFLPAVGQGAIAVETLTGSVAHELIAALDHEETRRTVTAERAYLAYFGLGCNVPLAAYGTVEKDKLRLQAMLGDETSGRLFATEAMGLDPQVLGRKVAKLLEETTKFG